MLILLFSVTGFMFEELVLVAEDSEDKITSFLSLLEANSSLKLHQSSLQEGFSTTSSMAIVTYLFTF